jgi:8-oxo-dGTP diphosphatase
MDPAAIAIVYDPQDPQSVLWVKRRDLNIWVLPGGGIDAGESPEEACLRELKEECSLDGTIIRKAAKLLPTNKLTAITHLYICKPLENDFELKPTEEAVCSGFFPLKNPPSPHFPIHASWIREVESKPDYFERPITELSAFTIAWYLLSHPFLCLQYLFRRLLSP